MEQVTLQEMNDLGKQIAELREKEREASDVKKAITKDLEEAEAKATQILMDKELKNYRSPFGLMSLAMLTSAKTPKTPEAKAAVFELLRREGRYDDMVSVNSQTLNSYVKEQCELAREQGLPEPEILKLLEVTVTPRLSFTRPK